MRISFFTIFFLLGLTFSGNILLGQQSGCTYDTIRLVRDRFVGIGVYYSNTRITKNNSLSSLFKISTEIHYLTKRNIKDGDWSSYIGLGPDLSDGASWRLGKDISKETTSLNCKIEIYCRGIQNRISAANVFDSDHYLGTELMEPILEWEKGASGIVRVGEVFCGQFQMILDPKKMNDFSKWMKQVNEHDNTSGKELPKTNKDFAIWCSLMNEEIAIIYNPEENVIYMYNDSVLLGLYYPEKRKFLSRKSDNENPFLLVKNNLDENARINLLFLSMLCQWFMNVSVIY